MRNKCKRILLYLFAIIAVTCFFSGCTTKAEPKIDTSSFCVGYDVHMLKDLLFIPNYFDAWYGTNGEYDDAIENWTNLEFNLAEEKLLAVEDIIQGSDNAYYPDDIAMVRHSLGCLYTDVAQYDKAYEYLVDAYVTMQEVYAAKDDITVAEQYYPKAVGLSLCRYYYLVGDYDRCLKEIQSIKDYDAEYGTDDAETEYLKLFVNFGLNNLEADIYKDRGEYEEASKLYVENMYACKNYVETEEDATFGYMLTIEASVQLADIYAIQITNPDYADFAVMLYDGAINLCDQFDGDFKEKYKSRVLLKKGAFLLNFSDKTDLAWEAINEALDIHGILYDPNNVENMNPDILEVFLSYAEILGFICNDSEEALACYEEALEIAESEYGENHPQTAKVYESLGRFYGNRMNDTETALFYFEKTVRIYHNLLIEENVLMASTYLQMAGAYKILGDNDLSDKYLEQAYSMYERLGIKILQTSGAESD